MTGLPEWLIAHLDTTGRRNADGIGRSASLTRCRGCGRRVLAGLDGDLAAGAVMCDPHEIDVRGELLALALNLRTYMLSRATTSAGKATWNLDPRNQWAIAAGQRTALVAAHRCGIAIPPAATTWLPTLTYSPTPEHPNF